MKKLIAVVLTVALLLSFSTAFAASSKKTDDLTTVEDTIIFEYENDGTDAAVALLQEKGTEEFFTADALAAAKELLGSEAIEVNEMTGIGAHDYDPSMGAIRVNFIFPTPYTAGEKVAVLIGIPDGADGYTWTVLEGVGAANGGVEFTIPSNLITKLENGGALIAIINK